MTNEHIRLAQIHYLKWQCMWLVDNSYRRNKRKIAGDLHKGGPPGGVIHWGKATTSPNTIT